MENNNKLKCEFYFLGELPVRLVVDLESRNRYAYGFKDGEFKRDDTLILRLMDHENAVNIEEMSQDSIDFYNSQDKKDKSNKLVNILTAFKASKSSLTNGMA